VSGLDNPFDRRSRFEIGIVDSRQTRDQDIAALFNFDNARIFTRTLAGLAATFIISPVAGLRMSVTSLQQRLVKTGGRLIKHARYYWLLLAESHLMRRLFESMLRRIAMLRRQQDRRVAEHSKFR
jgi:hypothetical protein